MNDKDVMQMALEALKRTGTEPGTLEWEREDEAQKALYEALAQPLFAAPPQRKPLTDDEIKALVNMCFGLSYYTFVRAIERAHGIGGEA